MTIECSIPLKLWCKKRKIKNIYGPKLSLFKGTIINILEIKWSRWTKMESVYRSKLVFLKHMTKILFRPKLKYNFLKFVIN